MTYEGQFSEWFAWCSCLIRRDLATTSENKPPLLQIFFLLWRSSSSCRHILPEIPLATRQLLAEDTSYFLAISQRSGQKPVPSIPHFGCKFRGVVQESKFQATDPLTSKFVLNTKPRTPLGCPGHWYSCAFSKVQLLQSGSWRKTNLIQRLLERNYGGHTSNVPTAAYLAPLPKLPDSSKQKLIAPPYLSFPRNSPTLWRPWSRVDLVACPHGQKWVSTFNHCLRCCCDVLRWTSSWLEIIFSPKTNVINITIFKERHGAAFKFLLPWHSNTIRNKASDLFARFLQVVSAGRNNRINSSTWMAMMKCFRKSISGRQYWMLLRWIQDSKERGSAGPMDFAIVTGWQVCPLDFPDLSWGCLCLSIRSPNLRSKLKCRQCPPARPVIEVSSSSKLGR